MCRKAHGSAFGSFLHVRAEDFRWIAGSEQVTNYATVKGNVRAFCSQCGSNVPVIPAGGYPVNIPAGTLDDDPGVRPAVHIYTASMAPWHEITDELEQFEGFPPDEWIKETLGDWGSGNEPT